MTVIKLAIIINAGPEVCFDLARSIDFHMVSTGSTREKAIAGCTTGLIEFDQTVTWRARHFGVFQQFTSRISVFDRPHHFRDEMVKGIFRSFCHDHYFHPLPGGRTEMTDELHFESPLGVLGRVANWLCLERYLRHFLTSRNHLIRTYAETGKYSEFIK
ncbi:MAG: SRPBCC family protein [Bacteroidota bacterium]|nr:SRPBCC family protein [Bacteroidota bacterium]